MALIAGLRFCEYARSQLDESDSFMFERIMLPGVNHELAKITLNGESALCDPWADYSSEVTVSATHSASATANIRMKDPTNASRHERMLASC